MNMKLDTHVAYLEYVNLLSSAEDLIALKFEDYESEQWAREMDAMARAEAHYFESFQPHVDDMDHEDRMGWS